MERTMCGKGENGVAVEVPEQASRTPATGSGIWCRKPATTWLPLGTGMHSLPSPGAPKAIGSKFQTQTLGSEKRGCLEPEVNSVSPGVYIGWQWPGVDAESTHALALWTYSASQFDQLGLEGRSVSQEEGPTRIRKVTVQGRHLVLALKTEN